MDPNTIVAIVGLFVTYLTSLIAIYVNIKVKLKEMEVKLASIQSELTEHKSSTERDISKLISDQREDNKLIHTKLDSLLEKIFELTKNNK